MKKNISVLLVIACMITSNVSFVTVSTAEENQAATIDETKNAGVDVSFADGYINTAGNR